MKNLPVVAVVAASLVGMQAMAYVGMSISAADLFTSDGLTLAPLNTVGLWIVDTSGGTSLSPVLTLGENIALGTTLAGTTDKIISVNDINNSTATPGQYADGITLAYGSGIGTGVAAGQNFGIIWLVNQSLSVTTAEAGYYGEFTDWPGSYSNPWVTPPNFYTISYDMTTVSEDGTVPNSTGIANLVIVPEPSSIMLVAVGLLGGIGLIRRRR